MINPPFDKEKQKATCFQRLAAASGGFKVMLKLLCNESDDLDEALKHVDQSVECAKKAIEATLDSEDA
jgi:hypothetical protein